MLRRILFTVLAVGGSIPLSLVLLWAIEGNPSAAGQERKNCPPGFVWIRMSGIGCVQEKLPANAKISYEGYSICEDGYTGTYERRATTDGEPAPGTPYTSFAYLVRCEKTGAGSGGGITGAGGGITRDAAKKLYDDGYGPLPGDLAGAGGLVAGAATLAAAGGLIARGWGAGAQASSARMAELAKRLAELDHEIAKAHKEDQEARKVIEEMTEKSKPWKKRLDDLVKLYSEMGGSLLKLETQVLDLKIGEGFLWVGGLLGTLAGFPALKLAAAWAYAGFGTGLASSLTGVLHRITGQPTRADWEKLVGLTKKAMKGVDNLIEGTRKEYFKLQGQLRKAQYQSHDARERLWRLQEERKDVYQQYKWAQGDERSRRFQHWLKSSR